LRFIFFKLTQPLTTSTAQLLYIEAEFLDVIGTKVIRVFLLAIHSDLY
jgi:hypothetical protein